MRRLQTENPSEFEAMFRGQEYGLQGSRMARSMDSGDTFDQFGIGARGSAKHAVTARIDVATQWLSEKTNIVSGMRVWNRFWKIAAGVQRAHTLRDMVGRFDGLTDLQRADLATLGIGRFEANRLNEFLTKFGTTVDGKWDPNLDAWIETKGGREAARDFRIAIERDMSRAIITPSIGDTPRLMSNTAGKLWLQFQTFGFTFMNKVMIPASQRLGTYKDAEALAALGHLAWSTMIVLLAKDMIRGDDPMRRFESPEAWIRTSYDMVDRSGMLAFLSPYADSVLKLTSPAQDAVFGGSLRPSRFSRNSWLESLLGPGAGLFGDVQSFGSAVSRADTEKAWDKLLLLAPWNTYTRLANRGIEKILTEE